MVDRHSNVTQCDHRWMAVLSNCLRFKALTFACQHIGASEWDKFCKNNACLKEGVVYIFF